MSYNLADLPKDDMDKVNVDLAASGVAYKERMNMPVIPAEVAAQQPLRPRRWKSLWPAPQQREHKTPPRIFRQPRLPNSGRRIPQPISSARRPVHPGSHPHIYGVRSTPDDRSA